MSLSAICKLKNQRTIERSFRRYLIIFFLLSFGSLYFTQLLLASDRPDASYNAGGTVNFILTTEISGTATYTILCDNIAPTFTSGSMAVSANVPVSLYRHGKEWKLISGPGAMTFSAADAFETEACFSTEGTYILQFTAYDYSDLAAKQRFTTVSDKVAVMVEGIPEGLTLDCPDDITINALPGANSILVSWNPPDTSTTCPEQGILLEGSPASGTNFPVGQTTVEYTATDSCGNETTCSFIITVIEVPAVLTISNCPADTLIVIDEDSTGQIVNWTLPTGTTNCYLGSLVSVNQDSGLESGSFFPVGVHTISYTLTDLCGNSETCTFTIEIALSPETVSLTCPADFNIMLPPNASSVAVSWNLPTTSSSCTISLANPNCGTVPASFTLLGTLNQHEYLISDNIATWQDAELICNNYDAHLVTINNQLENDFLDANVSAVILIGINDAATEATFQWSSGETVAYTNFQSPDVNTPEKDYSVLQDWNGKWDMINPLVYKNYVMELNCEAANTVVLTQIAGPSPGAVLTAGTYTVTYQATDNCGDVDICSFTITVAENTQTISIDCPENITVYETSGANGAVVTFDDATATSTCANNAISINQSSGLPSGSVFPIGVSTVTYEATDSCSVYTCSFLINVLATPPALAPIPFPEFMGVNTRIQYPNERLSAVAGTVRDYYPWVLSEGFPDYENLGGPASPGYPFNKYKFNPAYQGQGYKNLDLHYSEIGGQNLILNTSMLQTTPQLVSQFLVPNSASRDAILEQQPLYPLGSNSTDPASYIAHADWIYHFTARYGNNTFTTDRQSSIIAPKLQASETALTGLGHLQYIENWNEPDKWWYQNSFPSTHFTGYEYAAMTSADYDGHMQTLSLINDPDNPAQQISIVGAKNADPSIKFVLAGLANLKLNYIDSMRVWFDANRNANASYGLYPFDVLNFHHYSYRPLPDSEGVGVSPEEDFLRDRLSAIMNYRNQYFPGKEVWLSEFGYDTNISSTRRVPTEGIGDYDQREVQGQWIVRSFLEISAAGVDRAHLYEFRDGCTGISTCGTFFSSGLLESSSNDYKPKKSWYYVATLKHVMQGMEFDADISPSCSTFDTICATNCARVYRFIDPNNPSERVYAIWSPTSCGNAPFNYTLDLEGATAATLYELEVLSTIGKRTLVNGSSVTIAVSERPVFIKVGTATPPATVSCPNNLTVGLQTCSTIRLNWAPTPGVSTLQLWYQEGHLASIADFDINSALLSVDNYAVGIGNYLQTGLKPNTNYSFIVISVDAVGNISEPCLLLTNTSTNTCTMPIDPAWIYDSNNPANPPIELFDEQASFDPFCGNTGAPATAWGVTYNNDGPEFVSMDLQEEVTLNAIALFDASDIGILQIDYSLSPTGPWTDLIDYQTNSFSEWVYLDNLLPPNTPLRYLRITGSLDNDAIINEMFICVEPMDVDGDGYTVAQGDCNDANATIHPGATEICDGIDNDCDESVDEGLVFLNYYPDADGDGYGANVAPISACSPPTNMVTNNEDCNDGNAAINPAATEICDGIDNDCDGNIDDGIVFQNYYPDADGDGYGANVAPISACCPLTNMVTNNQDCNDGNAAINPAATEICDGIDNDCDGNIDDGIVFQNYYPDADGDGYGANVAPISACSPPTNMVTNNQDCNDGNAAINPAATEICDGIDNDCDGNIDDDVVFQNYYPDADGDAYGANASPISACSPPANTATNNQDCNDGNAAINPAATEICDGIDNDCDGNIDDGIVFQNYYPDADGDSYGANVAPISACSPPANMVTNNGDCNDGNAAINPAAIEICDGIDNDCDGNIDDGIVFQNYYPDADGDGYGANATPISACSPPTNMVTNNLDCNDANAAINPAAMEVCNDSQDNNCNGLIDEDNQAPSVTCINYTVALVAGVATITPANVYASGSDNCGAVNLVSVAPSSFTSANVGNNTVTLTVSDAVGNTNTCQATVTVTNSAGTISLTCPANQTLVLPVGATSMVVNWPLPTVSSTCGGGSGNPNCGTSLPGFALVGSLDNHEYYLSSTVEYWQTGNTICAGFGADLATISSAAENAFIKNNISEIAYIGLNDAQVEGQLAWDNGEPVDYLNFNGSGSNSANNDYTQFQPWDGKWDMISALVKKKILMELECGDAGLDLDKLSGPDNGSSLSVGTYTIIYEATDNCGDVQTCSFTITIQNNPQTISLTCPANQTVTAASGATGANVSWAAATGTTSCSTGGLSINQTGGAASGSLFAIGSHTITYTATDNCSTTTCSFVITVLPFAPPTSYCASSGSAPWQQWISNVSFKTINNNSGKNGYGNFTGISTTVNQGSTYTFSLTPAFSWDIWNEYVRVWIDYNKDFDFNDPGELVLEQISQAGTPPYPPTPVDLINGTITIPAAALTGSTRMRVSMKKDAYAGPCEAFVFGEVEDYTIIINTAAPPPLIGEDAAILFFDAAKSGREVQLQWVTNTGYKNDYYVLERSTDGTQFQVLANISNTSDFAEARQFQFPDKLPIAGSNFYRLIQVFKDGSSRFSEIKRVDFDLDVNAIGLYPNPAEQEIYADLGTYAGLVAGLQIYNSLGQPISSLHFDVLPAEPIRIDLKEMQAGVYYLSVKAVNKKLITQKFVVIRR